MRTATETLKQGWSIAKKHDLKDLNVHADFKDFVEG